MIKRVLPALAVACSLLSAPWASAATAAKAFSGFKGTYSGSSTLTSAKVSGSGTMTATISVPKNGRSAEITLSGLVVVSGTGKVPVVGTIKLVNGVATLSDLGLGLGEGTLYPGSGTYTFKSAKAVTIEATSSNGYTFKGTARLTPQGKKRQKVTLKTTLTVPDTGVFKFVFALSGKAPKVSK